ncbi:MAG TPA: hypothetical protein VG276_26170, partial [Actinomycetes bacterium]|nr:hypothetical protein [Actinomycetes bacterium]
MQWFGHRRDGCHRTGVTSGHDHQRLGDTVDALASALYGHLTHEERDVLPLIDQSLTQAEWRAFGNDQR